MENSKIEWTDHTFNPWRGCEKIAPGCANCYAAAFAKRNPGLLGEWGSHGTRIVASAEKWAEPVKWNKQAPLMVQCAGCGHRHILPKGMEETFCPKCGDPEGHTVRPRLFCASVADVFEDIGSDYVFDHRGNRVYREFEGALRPNDPADNYRVGLEELRRDLFPLIDNTQNLDWLVLTKRPENIRPMIERCPPVHYRDNLWLGVSVANQADADRNIPLLLQCRDLAAVLFVSYEPAIAAVDFTPWIGGRSYRCDCGYHDTENELIAMGGDFYACQECGKRCEVGSTLDWVIVGGESGRNARPFDLSWARSTVQQCAEAGVPCFVKQLGAVTLDSGFCEPDGTPSVILGMKSKKGDDPAEWPQDLRIRQFPEARR